MTADTDRPLSVQAMADDTPAPLASLGIGQADLFGHSLGAGIALNIITNHPDVVRKAVLASVTYDKDRFCPPGNAPGGPENIRGVRGCACGRPADSLRAGNTGALTRGSRPVLSRSPWAMDLPEITPQAISAIDVPILLIIGDSDIVIPEHAVAMFRLLGGGVLGDLAPMPPPGSPSCRGPRTSGSPAAPTC